MRLSSNEQKILSTVQFNANASIPEIQKKSGLKAQAVQYSLARLKEKGLLRPWPLVDTYRLGFVQYEAAISLSSEGQQRKKKILAFVDRHPAITWYAETTGGFDFIFIVCAKRADEVVKVLAALEGCCGSVIRSKSISTILSLTLFSKKYLLPAGVKAGSIEIGMTDLRSSVDAADRKILNLLSRGDGISHRSVARELGLPRTTVDYRVGRLEKEGIIRSFVCRISASRMELLRCRFLVSLRSREEKLSRAFHAFALRNRFIVNLISCLGSWDFEMTAEVETVSQADQLLDALYREFGRAIEEVRTLSVVRQGQPSSVYLGL